MTQTYGIVAHPVSHSLSPPMQSAAFRQFGIDAEFIRFDIMPDDLSAFINRVRQEGISGLAVSLPHKETIIPLLDEISDTAKTIGAVNTVFWREGKLCGENTDAPGFWEAVSSALQNQTNLKAAVIGAGGAARAIVYMLNSQNISVTVFNRTLQKAQALALEFDCGSNDITSFNANDFDLVINATSVGLKTDLSPLPDKSWKGFSGVAFDAVFNPLFTRFLRDAKSSGATIVTGEKMLLYQGTRQFKIWTGNKAPVEVMRSALEEALQD